MPNTPLTDKQFIEFVREQAREPSPNSVALIKEQLDLGANLRAESDNKGNLLHVCASLDAAQIIDFLLQQGLDPHKKDDDGWDPLHCCAQNNCYNVIKILIEHHAVEITKDKSDRTFFHTAAVYRAIESMEKILDYLQLQNNDQDMFLLLSQESKKGESVIGLLNKHQRMYKDVQLLRRMLNYSKDYQAAYKSGFTPLKQSRKKRKRSGNKEEPPACKRPFMKSSAKVIP